MIRVAVESDLPVLRMIEVEAGAAFADIGMPEIAAAPAPGLDLLRGFLPDRCQVVDDDGPVAYLTMSLVDGRAHIEQLSVRPRYRGARLGAALIDHLGETTGLPLTLTTFVEVPWNLPYYERLGFRRLTAVEETPGLRRIRRREAGLGLDRWPRACMRRPPVAKTGAGPD